MAIVSSVYELSGGHVVERHTDHLGNQYMRTYFNSPGLDIAAHMAAYVPVLEQVLADAEAERLLNG